MPCLELRNLVLGPRRVTVTANLETLDAERRIGGDHTDIDCVVEQQPENLEEIVGGIRPCLVSVFPSTVSRRRQRVG
jgi:hypothetical protein